MKTYIGNSVVSQEENGVYIVFEAGPTHYNIESAKQLASMAKHAGADAIKYQFVRTDRFIADKSILFDYEVLVRDKNGTEKFEKVTEPLADILVRRELTDSEWRELKSHCDSIGITMFSTATYPNEVDFLIDELGTGSIKINSSDINELDFIRYCASKGVNLQLDTGNADIWEVERAVIEAEQAGCDNIIIHLCPTGYPARLESINLRMIKTLKQMFPNYAIAFSDHSPGMEMDIAAVALGADMVEKTITLDRTIRSCEHSFSLEEKEAIEFVKSIKTLEVALGENRRVFSQEEKAKRKLTRRSPYAIKDLKAGDVIDQSSFEFKRPGFGVTNEEFRQMLGKTLIKDISINQKLTYDHI